VLGGKTTPVSHTHAHGDADAGPLGTALALVVAFMAAEVALGVVAHSLALLSDAAHMLVDAVALALSVWAARLAQRPPGGRMTFGFRRAEILSAQINGLTLLLLGLAIVVEGARRLVSPPHVHGTIVVATAVAGAAVNVVALSQVARANRTSLNVEGSYRHLLTDAVAASMLAAAWPLLRRSSGILLEAAPEGVKPSEIAGALRAQAGVTDVHDLHVWEISSGFPALSAHVLVEPGDDCHRIRRELEQILRDRFAITHTTLQVDHARRGLLTIEPLRSGRRDR